MNKSYNFCKFILLSNNINNINTTIKNKCYEITIKRPNNIELELYLY